MQGTWVRSLAREDPTCRGATKPVHHNYLACALEPGMPEDLLFFYDHLRKVIGVTGVELLYCYHCYMATHFVLQATI
ncbi:hypothetical protein J1605_010515 [Eschrichtius robustus]|uniref:Uncharacterized protein n=1 Tax=Eschrichtius robustus TaxID=9764 RepID=A0AB34GSM2_ESCRO|nr:hypothetical protein J1605_010515 [Eschrichtius robustus]